MNVSTLRRSKIEFYRELGPASAGWGAFMKEGGSAPTQVDGVLWKPQRSKELRETLARLTDKAARG